LAGAGPSWHCTARRRHPAPIPARAGRHRVGTGINARPQFGAAFARQLAASTGIEFRPSGNYFEALSSQDTAVELSGQLKVLGVTLMKISNDLRWMNSGPLAGLGEIALPALQPAAASCPARSIPSSPNPSP